MSEHLVRFDHISELLTLSGVAQKKGRHPTTQDLGILKDASIIGDQEKNEILWVGPTHQVPSEYNSIENKANAQGEVWLPEFVECHTHLIYAGNRHHDFALRCSGSTYLEIAEKGGGILSTMLATRNASLLELIEKGAEELERFQGYGVGVIEAKTGYGLTLESELKVLEAIKGLQATTSVLLVPTFLPAHATPPEFKGKTDEYVDTICKEWVPEVSKQKLATFFDVFIEKGFFNFSQTEKLLNTALEFGFKLKLHTDQFNDLGGTALAVKLGATSVDHLDHISPTGIEKLGQSDTVAVLLPGASLYAKTPYPPARKLIDNGARVALSTDFNPGTCPSRNLPLMTTLACSQMGMSVAESIAGITYNAAAALGLENQLGSLEVGKQFRVVHFSAESHEVIPYCFGELN